jgi:hypothetical protein
MTTTPSIENVRVLHRAGQWCPGRRIGEIVAYDVRTLPEYQVMPSVRDRSQPPSAPPSSAERSTSSASTYALPRRVPLILRTSFRRS